MLSKKIFNVRKKIIIYKQDLMHHTFAGFRCGTGMGLGLWRRRPAWSGI